MSIQIDKYTSKKTGKTKTTYYARVWHPLLKKPIYGEKRETRKLAVKDESALIDTVEDDIKNAEKDNIAQEKEKFIFHHVAMKWFKHSKSEYSGATYKVYLSNYNNYLKGIFGQEDIREITSDHILTFKEMLLDGKNEKKKQYAPETVNKYINILCDIFNFAVSPLKLIPANENPTLGIKRCKVLYKKKTTWTDEEVSNFLLSSEAKSSHYYPMFCVSLLLGPRPGEVCGFAEHDFSIKSHTLSINRGYSKYGELSDTKNKGSIREVYVPDTLYNILRQVLLQKKQIKLQYPEIFDNDFLFNTTKGKPVNPDYYSKTFSKVLECYNKSHDYPLPIIPLYNCRHSFATNNYARGEQDKVLCSIMGNSVKTFLTNYVHIKGTQEQNVISGYEDAIFKEAK